MSQEIQHAILVRVSSWDELADAMKHIPKKYRASYPDYEFDNENQRVVYLEKIKDD